jgi:hypothetical protein
MIEETLRTLITTSPAMQALMGTGKWLWANVAEQQGRYPCIVYQQITGPRTYTHDGDSILSYPRYQFSCWAETYAQAKAVAEALTTLLSGYSNPPEIQVIFVDYEMDTYDQDVNAHRALVDFRVWHK